MKKITLVLFALIFSISLFSQNCVTTYSEENFGLADQYGEIVFLEVAPDSVKWFGLDFNFMGGGGLGIGKFDGETWTAFNTGNSDLPNDIVYDIAFDTSGYVWVATESGLAKFDGSSTTGWEIFDGTDFGVGENIVTAVAIDSGYVKWLGLESGKVLRFNDTTWTLFTEWVNGPVNVINIDSSHNVWCGMGSTPGMAVYDHLTWTTYPQYSNITSIEFVGTTKVMVSDYNNLHIYEDGEWTDIPDPGQAFYEIAVNSKNEVWISSSTGIFQFRDSIFIPYTHENSGMPNGVFPQDNPCAFDFEDNLWFAYQYTIPNSYCATGFFKENEGLGLDIFSENNFTFCEGDSTILDAGLGFNQYKWSTGGSNDSLIIYQSDTIHVAVNDGAGCWDYDTVETIMHEVFEFEEICVVTVLDSQNVVVWGRTADVGTDHYNIYKETEKTDVYELIGTVPFTLLSVFVDPDSEVGIRSERYKIAAVDSCLNESELSFHHKTMHLTLNVGVGGETNLIWDGYEGFDFVSYIIYRGTRVDNLVPLDTVPSNTFTWTDPEIGDFIYKIGVVMPGICSPNILLKAGAGPYSHSFSNEESRLQAKAPPTDLSMTDTTIMDSEPAGAFVGKLLTNGTDTLDYIYTLVTGEGDTDNASFTVSNDSLFSASMLEYAVQELYSVRIRTTDAEADSFLLEKVFTIKVLPVTNDAPTDILISADAVDEGLPAGTFVGEFTTTDPDAGDTHTYALVSGDGDADNASFTISDDTLYTAAEFDFDTRAAYNIRVRTTDDGAGNLTFDKQFVINVSEVGTNSAPTDISLSNSSIDENQDVGTLVGKLTTTDADGGDTHTYSLVEVDDHASFSITNDSLVSAEVFDYDVKSSYSVTIRSTDDGSLHFDKQFTVTINDVIGIADVQNGLNIYPIPMTDRLNLEFNYASGQDYSVVITDLNGQQIRMIDKIQSGSIEIDASELAPGVYILELRGPELLRVRILKAK